jgi:hypothetical protein
VSPRDVEGAWGISARDFISIARTGFGDMAVGGRDMSAWGFEEAVRHDFQLPAPRFTLKVHGDPRA